MSSLTSPGKSTEASSLLSKADPLFKDLEFNSPVDVASLASSLFAYDCSTSTLDSRQTGQQAAVGGVPTSARLSKGLDPPTIKAHSHNDEMQKVPLTHALALGYLSIECDVWLVDSKVLAGHQKEDLREGVTLQKLYLDPLWKLLEEANPEEGAGGKGGWTGIYKDDPEISLILQVDMKGDGEAVWPYILNLLQPFFQRGWLTTFDCDSSANPITGRLTAGRLTIIGAGETPAHLVVSQNPRYIFYDAPLLTIKRPLIMPNGKRIPWHPSFAPTASSKLPAYWYTGSPWLHFDEIKKVSDDAHAKGIEVRWWEVKMPGKALMVAMWDLLLRTGSDWINTDDLEDTARFLRGCKNNEDGEEDTLTLT